MTTDQIMELVEDCCSRYYHCGLNSWSGQNHVAEEHLKIGRASKERVRAALAQPPWHPASEPIVPPAGGGYYWLEDKVSDAIFPVWCWSYCEWVYVRGQSIDFSVKGDRVTLAQFIEVVRWSGPIQPPPLPK